MTEGYTDVEIDPFSASDSILKNPPAGWDPAIMAGRFAQPATQKDLLDFVTAQSALNVTIMAALVAVWQKRDSELTNKLGELLGQVAQFSEMSANLTVRIVADSGEVERERTDGSSTEDDTRG